jgi:hypothetical protein
VARIAPAKRNPPVSKRDRAVIGDGHAMGVTGQITEHMLWVVFFDFQWAGFTENFFGATWEQTKNGSELVSTSEATTWIDSASLKKADALSN